MTEHEKRASENIYRVRYAHAGGKNHFAVRDTLEKFFASGATKLEVEFVDYKEIKRVKAEAHAAGRREAEEGVSTRELFAYKNGYDSGRSEVIAEVMPVLDMATGKLEGIYPEMTVREGLTLTVARLAEIDERARALIERLKRLK